MCPDVGTLVRRTPRQVAQQQDATSARLLVQLQHSQVNRELSMSQFIQSCARRDLELRQRDAIVQTQSNRPLRPIRTKSSTQKAESAVVVQPKRRGANEVVIGIGMQFDIRSQRLRVTQSERRINQCGV